MIDNSLIQLHLCIVMYKTCQSRSRMVWNALRNEKYVVQVLEVKIPQGVGRIRQ